MIKGLYSKYVVFDAKTEQQVDGFCFVLKPGSDPAAWDALWAYARALDVNDKLRTDLVIWLMENEKPLPHPQASTSYSDEEKKDGKPGV